jgi:predicted enzyme related to lactoylglutathione lyase
MYKHYTRPLSVLRQASLTWRTSRKAAAMSSIANAKCLDHLVLTVRDLDASIKFYQGVMGMRLESFSPATSPGTKRYALKFGSQKINLHVSGKEFEPKARCVTMRIKSWCRGIDTKARMFSPAAPTSVSLSRNLSMRWSEAYRPGASKCWKGGWW